MGTVEFAGFHEALELLPDSPGSGLCASEALTDHLEGRPS